MKQKIFEALVVDHKQKTAAQLAAQLGTTAKTVAARISEIRDEGYAIYSNRQTDTKGRVKYFYRHGSPSRTVVRASRVLFKAIGVVGQR
jgi:predicted ArsR family transcriptional regulator